MRSKQEIVLNIELNHINGETNDFLQNNTATILYRKMTEENAKT